MVNKEQRVGVFVDVQNLYYSAKNLYNQKVNFANILKDVVDGRKIIRALAYVIKTEAMKEKTFFDALEKIGYEIKSKDLQIFFGGAKKGDWDVGIAMDIIEMAPKLDVIILVSGDGDFVPLLQHAMSAGCRVEAAAFGRSASSKLKEAVQNFIDLDKNKTKYLIKEQRKPRAVIKPAQAAPKIAKR
jgi:uncharacterized LabA/DUF88 family protein